ncbi:hypothetical protein FAES_1816 [Fibrella aestuarina BUZ 2]|uniref:Uncharacterized protein n=1 Tax=Fibrella aestuarina BUZ 2 TaxID=1166018 RepID=I0K6S3_9BACT|nr:hypothetical protein [Fibrella aestuarina]CCG99826.1 hypothetical protein FAES_1816 [Fibrella aestuarina BUZ 2]
MNILSIAAGALCIVCAAMIYADAAIQHGWKRSFLKISPALGWFVAGFAIPLFPAQEALFCIGSYLLITHTLVEIMKQRSSFREARDKVPPETDEWIRRRKPITWAAIILLAGYIVASCIGPIKSADAAQDEQPVELPTTSPALEQSKTEWDSVGREKPQ